MILFIKDNLINFKKGDVNSCVEKLLISVEYYVNN